MPQEDFTFTTTVSIPSQRMADLLVAAIETGSSYWVRDLTPGPGLPKTHHWYSSGPVLLSPGWGFVAYFDGKDEKEGSGLSVRFITSADLVRAIRLMHDKEPYQFNNFLQEDEDSVTGDVFMQLLLMDEVVYG